MNWGDTPQPSGDHREGDAIFKGVTVVTKQQKIIIAALSGVAVLVLAGLGCAAALLLVPHSASAPAVAVVAASSPPTSLPAPSSTPMPTVTTTPAPLPTPTSTRVVVETVQPSPTPTRANCIDQVTNFGASGVITDDQVKQFLHQTIPAGHLDGCRGIEYIPQQAQLHDTPLAGSIIPVYREIQVYAVSAQYQTTDQVLDTIVHEIGHNVHKNIRSTDMNLDGRWAELYRQSEDTFVRNGLGFVSDYARANKFEDFAETYMAYVRHPEILKYYNPLKYEFMRLEVFQGQEYPP